jgi:hypothetical protein
MIALMLTLPYDRLRSHAQTNPARTPTTMTVPLFMMSFPTGGSDRGVVSGVLSVPITLLPARPRRRCTGALSRYDSPGAYPPPCALRVHR